jgi:hypothetical protein
MAWLMLDYFTTGRQETNGVKKTSNTEPRGNAQGCVFQLNEEGIGHAGIYV